MAQPVTPSMQPSSHQPSSTDSCGTPLTAAFMPLVPDASSGACGVFSHRSAPADEPRGHRHVVVGEVGDLDLSAQRLHRPVQFADQRLAAVVLRVRLAGQHDLDRPGLGMDREQAREIEEQQVGALVGRDPAREAERERVERRNCAPLRWLTKSTSASFAAWCADHTSAGGMLSA